MMAILTTFIHDETEQQAALKVIGRVMGSN
jgi:hypothetical protein